MKTQKNGPFLRPKKFFYGGIFLFSIQEFIWAGEICQKNAPDLVNLGPQSTICNLHPNIWSHHPVLDFHTQITRKYITARGGGAFSAFEHG